MGGLADVRVRHVHILERALVEGTDQGPVVCLHRRLARLLVIEIQVETPTKLSARQKELLEQFRETETGEECPASKGFFQKLKSAWEELT